jgi:protocatechuate 3,4-dioxygenase beta subunit
MVSSARQAIACVLFIFLAAVCSHSQVAPLKTATISGKVTLKTKALAGIVVVARPWDSGGPPRSRYRSTTDENGNYRITNVLPGNYNVTPLAPGLVRDDEVTQKSVVIEEGDNVADVNFSMAQGGVITGKITDAEGKPLVEEEIIIEAVEGPYSQMPYYNGTMTDDRGVYRAFGLPAGKFRVSAGQGENRLPGNTRLYRQTYYPSVTDKDKATAVEVTEGGEARDIDIMLGRPLTSFRVTGKIVDGETGKPVPNVRYGIFHGTSQNGGHSTSAGATSNLNGEFKIDGVMPGTYSVFLMPEQNTEIRAEPVPFEVVDHDVTGLVLKTVRAASISGVVVMEGTDDPAALSKIGKLYIMAMSEPRPGQVYGNYAAAVGSDGSFTIKGLSPGVLNLALSFYGFSGNKPLALERVERDGLLQPSGVSVKEGEQITGVRLVARTLTATIRGQVKVEDGELPANARFSIWLVPLEESRRVTITNGSPQIDARGRFLIEGVAGGTYEINIAVFENGRNDSNRIFKQQVTVADNSVSEVTVTIKLNP